MRSRVGIIFRGTSRPMAPMQLWVASLFLILAVLPHSQAAPPAAADCLSLSASGTGLLAEVDGITLFDGNQQLTQPLIYEDGACVIVSGGASMVELDASQLTQPVIRVRGASTVCLHNLQIRGSTATVISASDASLVLLNTVNITASTLTSPGSLIEMDGSSLHVSNSAITNNILRKGRYSLINITADSRSSSVRSSLIADNTLSSASTLITVHFPAVPVTSFAMSGKTRITNNTAGRLLHATAPVLRASTLMGLNSSTATRASVLSNTNLLAIFSGTPNTTETASSLMGYIAARAASVMLNDTVFIGNQVVLELMALYAVHTQLHNVEFTANRGVGIPAMGVPAGKETCCVELMNNLSSFPNFMPASWRGAVFNKNAWNDSLECTTKQPVVLVTASLQPPPAQAVAGSDPRALDCGVPTGSRVASHLLYSFNGTVWMTNTTMRSNNFTYGSLMETSNHTTVILQDSVIKDNTAQTMLNCSSTTVYLNKTSYERARFEEVLRRELTILTDAASFAYNDGNLTQITEWLMREMQNAQLCIQGSNFTNNTFYSAVLRSWGTRSGQYSDPTSFVEESASWYLKSVHLSHNKLEDIGQPRQNTPSQWTTPSIISLIHANATLDDVTISNNSAVMIVNIEAASTTILNCHIQNNTLSPNSEAVMAPMWYTKWATLGFQNTSFEGNCPGASNTSLILLDSVMAYLIGSNFTGNFLAPTGSNLMNSMAYYTQLSIQRCIFTKNQAEKLVYAFQTRHVLTTQISFINNTGTCMHVDYPKKVYESQHHQTILTRMTFKGNVGAAHGSLYVTLGLNEALAICNQSIFADNQGEKGALVFEQDQPAAADVSLWTVSESQFLRNTAAQHGGAIAVIGGTLNLTYTAIVNNTALGTGGGIYADVSQYQLANVVVTGNKAQSAAGMALITQRGLEGGAAGAVMMSSLTNCTIEDNHIDLDSQRLITPPVLNCGLGGGGGLCLVSPAANFSQVVNTSFMNNRARYGGAVFIDCGLRSTNSECRTDVTLMEPYGIISRNTASTPASSVAMLSSRQVMQVKCSNQLDFHSLEELKEMPFKKCRGWQSARSNVGAVLTLGVTTGPKEVTFSVNGTQLEYNQEGLTKVVSGSAWNATVALLDEDGQVVVDMLDDIIIRLRAQEEDLVMVSRDHPGEVNISLSSMNTTDGQFVLSNIITWPSQGDPNNKLYKIQLAAESSHSKFPIAPKELKLILSRCTLGEYLLSSTHACQTCRSLNKIKPLFSLRPDIRCEPCPENGECSHGQGMLLPEPHYFQPSFLLPQIVRCPIPEACLQSRDLVKEIISWKEELGSIEANSSDVFDRWLQSGNGTVNSSSYSQKNELFMKLQCSPGYQGFLCGACAKHYGRYFGRCQRCLPVWANTILLLLVIAGMLGVVALLTSGHIRKTLRKHSANGLPGMIVASSMHTRTREPYMHRRATKSFLPSCMKWLDIMPDFSPQALEKVSHIFKVLTTFVQINSIMRGVQWLAPRSVRQFFSQMDFTSSPSAWVSLDCSLQHLGLDSEQLAIARSVFMILLPAFYILIAYSAWMLLFAWNVKKKRLPKQNWREFIVARFWLSTVQICYILYPVVTINTFDVFKCDPLSGAEDDMERSYWDKYKLEASGCNGTATGCNVPLWQSKWLWTQNHETVCGTGRHAALMWSLGLLSLIFFAVGVPVGLVALLLTNRHQLHDPRTVLQFGFLYEEYKEQFSFWESVIMARKVALLVIIIALPYIRSTYRQYIQISSSILVMMVCLLLHLTYQPFADKLLNRLETVSIVMTIANMYMITYWMIPDMSETIKVSVMVVLLFLNTFVIAYFVFELVYQFKHEAKAVADHMCGSPGYCNFLKGCRKQHDVGNNRSANTSMCSTNYDVEQNDHGANDTSNAAENGMSGIAGATVYRYGLRDTQLWRDNNHHSPRMVLLDDSGNQSSEVSVGHQGHGNQHGINNKEQGECIRYGDAIAMGEQLRFEVPQPPSSRQSTYPSVIFPHPIYSNVGVGVGTQPTGFHTGPITTTAGGGQLGSSFMHDVIQCPRLQPVQLPVQSMPPASHDSDVRSSSQQQPSEIGAPSGGEEEAERWRDGGAQGLPRQDNDHGSAGDDWRQL